MSYLWQIDVLLDVALFGETKHKCWTFLEMVEFPKSTNEHPLFLQLANHLPGIVILSGCECELDIEL